MKRLVLSALFASLTLLAACSGSEEPECVAGAASCACLPSGGCNDGLMCAGAVCAAVDCPLGTEGCGCLDGACGRDVGGQPLVCNGASLCESSACPAGDLGCACMNGTTCSSGSTCVDGLCRAERCLPGGLGCECLAGSCDPGLACRNLTCVDQTGRVGGACRADSTCDTNGRCDQTVVPATCVYCELGTLGCQCETGDACLPGLACVNGHCAGDETIQGRTPPADPKCYTACTDDLTDETGVVRRCGSDGYMEGCLDNLVCDSGECKLPDAPRTQCFSDGQCPEHQQCMRGYCYSNCDTDADCGDASLGCFAHVCRERCAVGTSNDCPNGTICESEDNVVGFCMASASPDTSAVNSSDTGTFEVTKTRLAFSNVSTIEEIQLINRSADFVTFTVRKAEHTIARADGTTENIELDANDTCTGPACPMWWIQMGEAGSLTGDASIAVRVPPSCELADTCPRITVELRQQVNAVRWRGSLRIESRLGSTAVDLSYAAQAEGQWAGKMVYFANFDDAGIDTTAQGQGWLSRPRRFVEARQGQPNDLPVANGLIQRWGAFRNGGLGGGWPEMAAVLVATESEQWRFPSVANDCVAQQGACYLFSEGVPGAFPRPYVTNLDASPIPTGSTIFPMAINVYAPDSAAPERLVGRVVSETALHYPGNPQVELRFVADPTDTANCDPAINGHCVTFLETATSPAETDGLVLDLTVGGRYPKPDGVSCANGFVEERFPWLVPGFLGGAQVVGGFYEQAWCVDMRLPGYATPIDQILPEVQVENRSLARGNPIPNGQVVKRHVQLLDGAMIDQSRIFILFRETFPSFLGGDDLTAYGYLMLERRPVDLDRADDNGNQIPDDYEGTMQPASITGAPGANQVQCSADLLAQLGVSQVNAQNAASVASNLISGGAPGPSQAWTPPTGNAATCTGGGTEIHYLCEETGLFNGGSDNVACWNAGGHANDDSCAQSNNGVCNDGGANSADAACTLGTDATDCGNRYRDTRVACPLESSVIFFAADASQHTTIVDHACQAAGTCASTLAQWTASGSVVTQLRPTFSCANGAATCDADPLDRRAGKIFYQPSASNVFFTPLLASIEDAFRYKTRFANRSGTNLGFTPAICQPLSVSAPPYCYDAAAIEQIRARVDCLLAIYEDFFSDPNDPMSATLFSYLEESFAAYEPGPATGERRRDGFERLYAELLIMLGDEAYTNAFESRFDLAGLSTAGFPGDDFEVGGLSISGIAGYEMFTLHQAVQYYSLVLDRFYRMSSVIAAALDSGSPQIARNFLSSATVTTYFDRLIRASTQRSRAWAEIARRYQGFGEAGLARRVAIRAYNQTYLESVALASVINRLYDISGGTNKPQLLLELERAQRAYSMALLDLGRVYQSLTDEVNILGFPPDYVPFPALGTGGANVDINAFERIYQFAETKLQVAARREQTALAETRTFDTDEASFQAELTRLSRTYESQLGELCGVFTGTDGQVYPAIEEYAFLSDRYAEYGDPCGFVGNGTIHEQIVSMDIARADLRNVMTQIENLHARIRNQTDRVEAVCGIQASIANANFATAEKTFNLEEEIIASEQSLQVAMQLFDTTVTVAETLACAPLQCPAAAVSAATILASSSVHMVTTVEQQIYARGRREEKAELERANAQWVELQQCEIARTEILFETKNQLLGLKELELSLLAAQLRLGLALSQVSKSRQLARRVELERREALELAINVQAARNDPNIRIYRNDAVLNAEIAFNDALEEAYRLTLVYEYYTSQSYAARDQLFLTRMVSAGDYNLENYIIELRNEFLAFEEVYGNPDLRVLQVSLQDDILGIPRVGEDGTALRVDERVALMRAALRDPQYLNEDGYIAIPFSTRLDSLSPLTRNHKIFYVEANVEGNDVGDYLGRVYLRQRGTSTVDTIGGGRSYFRFPQRTAVINPYFNSTREFSQEPGVYRSYRLRDMPLVNDTWELVFNQRDEAVNLDINLDQLTDIKLFVFYTDFTVF